MRLNIKLYCFTHTLKCEFYYKPRLVQLKQLSSTKLIYDAFQCRSYIGTILLKAKVKMDVLIESAFVKVELFPTT